MTEYLIDFEPFLEAVIITASADKLDVIVKVIRPALSFLTLRLASGTTSSPSESITVSIFSAITDCWFLIASLVVALLVSDWIFVEMALVCGLTELVSDCVVAVSEEFDTVTHKYELAVVASLPASHQRSLARQDVDSRVRQTAGGYVGAVDIKVDLDVEVVSANYSQSYGIFWVTAITQDNQAVFFSYRSKLTTGSWIQIKGTVKAHRDGKTQLNRVKIV